MRKQPRPGISAPAIPADKVGEWLDLVEDGDWEGFAALVAEWVTPIVADMELALCMCSYKIQKMGLERELYEDRRPEPESVIQRAFNIVLDECGLDGNGTHNAFSIKELETIKAALTVAITLEEKYVK